MDLDKIWKTFLDNLISSGPFEKVDMKKRAGIPFLYLSLVSPSERKMIESGIEIAAVKAMKGKRLNFELIYVRHEDQMYVYRSRFYVPQEKMFCCGNLCHDCIRFR